MGEGSNIRDAAEAVKAIVQAVPVYEDAIQPAAKELGHGLLTVAKAINVALAPVAGLVWGYEQIKGFVSRRVAEKLADVPPERIQPPDPNVVGPALEALRFTGHAETLREMYANLLANSLDSKTAVSAHPAFVDIIKSISPDEARVIKAFGTERHLPVLHVKAKLRNEHGYRTVRRYFCTIAEDAGCEHPALIESYLENLERLGLIFLPGNSSIGSPYIQNPPLYEGLEAHPTITALREEIEAAGKLELENEKQMAGITAFGLQFFEACVVDRGPVPPTGSQVD